MEWWQWMWTLVCLYKNSKKVDERGRMQRFMTEWRNPCSIFVVKPQTNGFSRFFIVLYFVAIVIVYSWRRFAAIRRWGVKTTPQKTSFIPQCESLQGLRVQVKNWVHGYSDNNRIDDTKYRAKPNNVCKWPETLGEHVSVVDANAWVFMHWRSFVFVVSLFVVS